MSDEPTEAARAAWCGGDLHALVDAYSRGDLTPQQRMAREQQDLATDGRAVGQCSSCGSYRLDGQPPILHEEDCPSYGTIPPWSMPGPSQGGP